MARSRNLADLINQNTVSRINALFELGQGAIAGLTIARASTTTFTVSTGAARSEDAGQTQRLQMTTTFTKSLSPWAVGSGNGSLDVATVLSSSWYHVHLIRRDSDAAMDILISLSATAPTMPSGWTARRRIGSFLTNGSSQITPFVQNGDLFTWDAQVNDVGVANPGVAAVTRALTVPTGVVVYPVVAWSMQNATTTVVQLLVSPLSIADNAPSATLYTLTTTGTLNSTPTCVVSDIPTNTSAQVRTRLSASGASDTLRGITLGWIDPRGSR